MIARISLASVICGLLAALPCRAQTEAQWAAMREQMVRQVIIGGGITNPRVIDAIRMTPRHLFVPPQHAPKAYYDMALPIGDEQTISSPYIVAFMTEVLDPQPTDKVLEIGTGSGYQAAVLSPLVKEVYTIEIVEPLAKRAQRTLESIGYRNVFVKTGDGYEGWEEHAPFDRIIVTCSPESVPRPLVEQLAEGGRMIIPVGERYQQTLYLFRKVEGRLKSETLRPTLFVPMTGEAESRRRVQPDSSHPQLVNGDFELAPKTGAEDGSAAPPAAPPAVRAVAPPGVASTEPEGAFIPGWYYQRQTYLVTDQPAPSGKQFALFQNREFGRSSQLLQGFAVDGTRVKAFWLSAFVRGENMQPGPAIDMWPNIVVTFYDEQRREVGTRSLGPWRGNVPWREVRDQVRVPSGAREAIVRVGLFGAVGAMAVDNIQLSVGGTPGEEAGGEEADRTRRSRRRREPETDTSP